MDPKSFAGKSPPTFDVLTPEFGARVSAWILGDMRRARKVKEDRARRKAEALHSPEQLARAQSAPKK